MRVMAAASMRLKMATPIMVRASGVRTSSSAGISATTVGSEIVATCCSKMERKLLKLRSKERKMHHTCGISAECQSRERDVGAGRVRT